MTYFGPCDAAQNSGRFIRHEKGWIRICSDAHYLFLPHTNWSEDILPDELSVYPCDGFTHSLAFSGGQSARVNLFNMNISTDDFKEHYFETSQRHVSVVANYCCYSKNGKFL